MNKPHIKRENEPGWIRRYPDPDAQGSVGNEREVKRQEGDVRRPLEETICTQ